MAPAATHPATVQPPHPAPRGLRSRVSPTQGEQQPPAPSHPSPGTVSPGVGPAAPQPQLCAYSTAGWPLAPPRGGCSTRRLLEAPTAAPPALTGTQACTDLPSSQSVDKGACGLADPRAFHVTLAPAPFLGKSPHVTGCLPAHLPWTQWGLARRGGIGRGCCCPHSSPPLPTQAPRLRDHRKAPLGLCHAGLAWHRARFPWAGQGLFCSEPSGAGLGRTAQCEGRVGHPSPLQRAPRGPAPRPVSATAPRAPPRPQHAPSCQSLPCGVAPSPRAGSAGPPLPCTLPGAFLCRFLNVILKSEKGYYAFL